MFQSELFKCDHGSLFYGRHLIFPLVTSYNAEEECDG